MNWQQARDEMEKQNNEDGIFNGDYIHGDILQSGRDSSKHKIKVRVKLYRHGDADRMERWAVRYLRKAR